MKILRKAKYDYYQNLDLKDLTDNLQLWKLLNRFKYNNYNNNYNYNKYWKWQHCYQWS